MKASAVKPAAKAREPQTRVPAPASVSWPQPLSISADASACACGGSCPRCRKTMQTKLSVSEPGDVYEQQADQVADQVMRMSSSEVPNGIGAKPAPGPRVTRLVSASTPQGRGTAPPIVDGVLRSPGEPLPTDARNFFESRLGRDFGAVRVHADAPAAESAHAVGARAYTVGRDLVFGVGQYAPETDAGRKLIAHELTHVLQQTQPLSMDSGIVQRDPLPGDGTENPTPMTGPPKATLTVHAGPGKKSKADLLTFPSKTTCDQDLGLHDCSTNAVWVWSVEIQADVNDDASQWKVAQSFTGRKKGNTKDASNALHSFDVTLKTPDDTPDSSFVQQGAGDKQLFWLDAPGHFYALSGDKVDSMTQVQNFVSTVCSTTKSSACFDVKWFFKLVVKPGAILDVKHSKAGLGTESTKF